MNMISKKVQTICILLVTLNSINAEAGVALGATRSIYPAGQKQITLGVSNNTAEGTFLIQSWIENSDNKKDVRFVITPPLFLMQGKKENTLRIIDATNGALPKDRESLFWINVKAIPSLDKEKQKDNTLQLAITSRIKLFYRPQNLSVEPEKAPGKLTFKRSENTLTLSNPSPYFVTVTEINAGTRSLENTMVPPLGSTTIRIPNDAGNTITYKTINDYGAVSEVMNVKL